MAMDFSEFTGLYPVQKTLKFELKPIGPSLENIQKYREEDKRRAEDYKKVKELFDQYHRDFITESLARSEITWADLDKAIVSRRNCSREDSAKAAKELDKIKDKYRKSIVDLFKNDSRYDILVDKSKIKEVLKNISKMDLDEEQKSALDSFDSFSVYFSGLHVNRQNMYSSEPHITSIAHRIVDENFPRFLDNCVKYQRVKKEKPEIILKLKTNLGEDTDPYFEISGFNKVLNQYGIDHYNYILGGAFDTERDSKQGLNVLLNLDSQKDKSASPNRMRLLPLYKQILSEETSHSFKIDVFIDGPQIWTTLKAFDAYLKSNDVIDNYVTLMSRIPEMDSSKIFINRTRLESLSTAITGSWDVLGGLLHDYYAREVGDPLLEKNRKKIEKKLSQSCIPLSDIHGAMGESYEGAINALKVNAEKHRDEYIDKFRLVERLDGAAIEKDNDVVSVLKGALECVMECLHTMKMFQVDADNDRDEEFYSEFDPLFDELFKVIPLYNKLRNYCTKSPYNKGKFKLNLGIPTLAGGWDYNKEADNKTFILRKGGHYYLVVSNRESGRIDLNDLIPGDSEDFYEKMDYKYFGDPTKMLPKKFFSRKGVKIYNPSKELLEGYEQKKHVKGESFDLDFCHKLIDYYKDCISKEESYRVFDFVFKETKDYDGMAAFNKDIVRQCYRISFKNISKTKVDALVSGGSLFMFEIYNKDFSEKSRGKPSLSTMYWRAAFSEENLNNTIIKLNGEAELFFREKSDVRTSVHKKGDILVKRNDSRRRHVPWHVLEEIVKFKKGEVDSLGSEAQGYYSEDLCKIAQYDIVKDRRYTIDKIYFHVPLTINFRSVDKTGINGRVLNMASSEEDVRIIGIDRGERNLVYITMIDGHGNILKQKSMNVVNGVDYHHKLDERQRDRQDARRNWTTIQNITNLKDGYISQLVNEISRMVVENNAILVMEDLNYGFKRGRFKIEKQIYQKFESALINKLQYLVIKEEDHERSPEVPGGVLRGYQLVEPVEGVGTPVKQTGVLFYVPAAFTSKIDPVTGFVNLFKKGLDSVSYKRDFLGKMNEIVYDPVEQCFAFTFDYRKYNTVVGVDRGVWTVFTKGERVVYNRGSHRYDVVNPTEIMSDALGSAGIDCACNLKEALSSAEGKVVEAVFRAFNLSMRMRNSNSEEDYIVSPVRNLDGGFYCSRDYASKDEADLPKDADANGAYHIALKGLLMLNLMKDSRDPDTGKVGKVNLTNKMWLDYAQSRRD